MNSRLLLSFFALLSILSLAQLTGNEAIAQTATVTLRQEWFPNSNYAGAVFAAREFATQNGIRLVVQAGADNIDPIKLVLSGESTFGDAGADRVLQANQKGADLVIIGVLNDINPTVFLAKQDQHIRTPSDFVGKRVGVLTGTSTEYVYRTLLAKRGIDKSSIKEVEVPFDLGTFIAGAYDVRPAFIYDEPVSLDLKNIPYTLIRPNDYGVSFLGTVYFTQRTVIEQQPELVQNFINSVAQGWDAALKRPEQAIRYLKDFDKTIDENRELRSLRKSMDYFRGYNGQLLRVDPAAWNATAKNLQELGVINAAPLGQALDMQFAEKFHRAAQ